MNQHRSVRHKMDSENSNPGSTGLWAGMLVCLGILVASSGLLTLQTPAVYKVLERIAEAAVVVLLVKLILLAMTQEATRSREQIDGELKRTVEYWRTSATVGGRAAAVGLTDIVGDFNNFNLGPIIAEARQLTVVLNDGRTWVSIYQNALRQRLKDSTKQTTLLLCHPDSAMLSVLARKGSIDVDGLRNRLFDTIAHFDQILQQSAGRVEILGHHLFNPCSLVLTESLAVLTPYMFSRGLKTVPVLVFNDTGENSFYRHLVDDIERLRIDAEPIVSPASTIREMPDLKRLR